MTKKGTLGIKGKRGRCSSTHRPPLCTCLRGTVATVLQWKTLQLSLFLIMTSACNLHATQTKKHANRQGDKIKDNSRPTARLLSADFCWKKKRQVNKLDADFKLCACHIQQHTRRGMNCNYNQSLMSLPKNWAVVSFSTSFHNHFITQNDEHSTSYM